MQTEPTKDEIQAALQELANRRAARSALPDDQELDAALLDYQGAMSQNDVEFGPRTLAAALRVILELRQRVDLLEAQVKALTLGDQNDRTLL